MAATFVAREDDRCNQPCDAALSAVVLARVLGPRERSSEGNTAAYRVFAAWQF